MDRWIGGVWVGREAGRRGVRFSLDFHEGSGVVVLCLFVLSSLPLSLCFFLFFVLSFLPLFVPFVFVPGEARVSRAREGGKEVTRD